MSTLAAVALMTIASAPPPEAVAKLASWRNEQDLRMREPCSPLARDSPRTLYRGHNRLGSGPQDSLRFSSPGVPEAAADFIWEGSTLRLNPLLPISMVNGQPAVAGPLPGGSTIVIGPLTLTLVGNPNAPSLAVCDASKPGVLNYRGLHYLPTNWAYRVPATFTAAAAGRTMTVDTSTGSQKTMPLKGTLHFELHGQKLSLDAFALGDHPTDYFVVFKDKTNGKETYGSGRFVHVPNAVDGKTVIDFNLAWNPLCAYSHLFNCPLAPPENRLSTPIPVGEATYPHDD